MSDVLTLLWKEYRTNAHLIIVGFAVLFLPVLLSISMTYSNAKGGSLSEIIGVGIIFGTIVGLILSQVMMICLGGFLIGGERSARTFEFLFNQPISRFKIVISKLLFALAWVVALWLMGIAMMMGGLQIVGSGRGFDFGGMWIVNFFLDVGVVGLMLFATCWLASNMIDGAVLAMAVGALITAFVYLLLQLMTSSTGSFLKFGDYDGTRIVVFSVLSIVLTNGGVRLFVRRKSP